MATPAITSQGVPMFGPDGDVHMVQRDQVDAAQGSGGEIAHQMKAPDGNLVYVRHSQLGDALRSGGVPMAAGTPSSAPSDRIADSLQNATISPPESGATAFFDRMYNRVRDAIGADHKPAGDVLGGAALGPIRALKGGSEAVTGHPIRGINDVVGGVGQTLALPTAVVNPATMAYAAPAVAAQKGVQAGLEKIGVDKDYAELGGNVAGVATGVGTVKGENVVNAVNSARGALAEKVVAPLVRKPLGATLEDAKFGRNPAQAITDEGLTGTKQQILEQAKSRVGQISDAVNQTLQNHPNSGAQIDAAPIIDNAIDNAVSSAKKTGNKAVVTRLENLREALKTEYGPTKGTPYEINNLKREVGQNGSDLGAFKSTDPLEASAAGAMSDVYSGLKKAVNEQVPEIAPLNERISNLMSAQTALKRNLALQENSSLLDSHTLFSAGAKAVKNTVASAPVRTFASRILNAGNALDVPESAPTNRIPDAVKARFDASRAAAESTANAVSVDDLQGGHAGNGVSSVEEMNRPGTNYVVSKGGQLTYHGKTFAPESTPNGSTHITVLPDGSIQVNDGPSLTPLQRLAIRRGIPQQRSMAAGNER